MMHRSDGFYHNFPYTSPNDEKFYRLKVKAITHVFLVLHFCKFGRLKAQNGQLPLIEAFLVQTPVSDWRWAKMPLPY